MERENLIPANDLCRYYNVQVSFIRRLNEEGLINIVRQEDDDFIETEALSEVERMIRLYNDLDINPEGIEAIQHLLTRMREMQDELTHLRNRLRFFEEM